MLFKRRKKEKYALSESEIKWNLLWDKYADGTLDKDYFALCDYHSGVNGEGHYGFFDNNEERLAEYVKSLKLLLPPDFFGEFEKAYIAYSRNDLNVEEVCDAADSYFYKNERTVTGILQAYANTLDK